MDVFTECHPTGQAVAFPYLDGRSETLGTGEVIMANISVHSRTGKIPLGTLDVRLIRRGSGEEEGIRNDEYSFSLESRTTKDNPDVDEGRRPDNKMARLRFLFRRSRSVRSARFRGQDDPAMSDGFGPLFLPSAFDRERRKS
jgi:hypothetical protein